MKNKYIIFGLILSLTCSFAHAQQVMVKEKKIGSNGTPTFLLFDTDSTPPLPRDCIAWFLSFPG